MGAVKPEYLDWGGIVAELRPGDRATGRFPGGLRLPNPGEGKALIREYSERTGRIVIAPVKHLDDINHFVLNMGGRHGTPGIIEEANFVAGYPANTRRILKLLK